MPMLWHGEWSTRCPDHPNALVDKARHMTDHVFLARQPIFDRERHTFGYELLYRNGMTDQVMFDDPDDATRCVIERALLDWGMERIIGDRFGFINASPQLIVAGLHRALPPEGIIIELREDEPLDGHAIDALLMARREGYHFALDNIVSHDQLVRSSVLGFASMVKVECSRLSEIEMARVVDEVRRRQPTALLVAEKIETMAEFDAAAVAGFDLFQGYFFARTEVLSRAARPSSVTSTIALLAEMQRVDIDINRVEQLVGTDPTLAFRVLAIVNSSAFGLDRRVESLRHAIVLLGVTQVRHLATLLALSASTDASVELIALGATRARLASAIAPSADLRSSAFTVGLLSVTDSLYGTPMDELLQELPVSAAIEDALLFGTGDLGWVMNVIRACENADVETLVELTADRFDEVQHAYAEAVGWADTIRAQLADKRSRTTLPERVPTSV
jgi:EAL and modified HD-GYP domain-containing signal transduction protein